MLFFANISGYFRLWAQECNSKFLVLNVPEMQIHNRNQDHEFPLNNINNFGNTKSECSAFESRVELTLKTDYWAGHMLTELIYLTRPHNAHSVLRSVAQKKSLPKTKDSNSFWCSLVHSQVICVYFHWTALVKPFLIMYEILKQLESTGYLK